MAAERVNVSLIKADVGGFSGDDQVHPHLMKRAREWLEKAKRKGFILDYRVTWCRDGLRLLMTHPQATSDEKIHKLAWETFVACTEAAKRMKLNGVMSYSRCQGESKADGFALAPGQPGGGGCGMTCERTPGNV